MSGLRLHCTDELAREFAAEPGELDNQFAILHHCQLLKAKREGDKIYLVAWWPIAM